MSECYNSILYKKFRRNGREKQIYYVLIARGMQELYVITCR